VRLLLIAALLGGFFVGFPASTSPRSTPEQADISRSGRDFLEVCSSVGNEGAGSGGGADGEGNRDAARTARDTTCLGWVAGFAEGFLVHDELVGIPRRDRLACVPNGESAIQIVRVMKRYLANNPEKAHRATRYIASLALAGAFPCRGGK
jgi:Ssp1 endopeptidase immunity protein Rap1a